MNAQAPRRSRLVRRARRLQGVGPLVLIVALAGSAPSIALGAGSSPAPAIPFTTQALDLAGLLETLQRGELPGDIVVIGTAAAIAAGFLLTLFVAALRSRRRRRSVDAPPEPAPEASRDPFSSRSTAPSPLSDPDVCPDDMSTAPGPLEERPDATAHPSIQAPMSAGWPAAHSTMAAEAEADAAREAALEGWPEDAAATIERHPIHGPSEREAPRPPSAGPTGDRSADLTVPAERASGTTGRRVAMRFTENAPFVTLRDGAQPGLGTPQAPIVVELRSERGSASGPSVSVVVAIAVVTIGVAFAGGALIGAGLGTTLGVTIGVAFAGGAGTAIGVTAMLLRERR